MKKSILSLLALAAVLTACSSSESGENTETESTPAISLEKAWETDTTLITPESLIYDEANDVFYVSCIGAVPPDAKDGDGYIAKISASGEILENHWVSGLDGPKGLALVGKTLYVADIDNLVAINTESGKIESTTKIEGATFLNDVASSANGDILFSDTNASILFKKSGDEISKLYEDSQIGRLNGVFVDGDQEVLVGFESGNLFTLKDGTLTAVADSLFGGDGIEKYKDGFFVSSWNGEVYHLDNAWKKTKLLDTKEEKMNAADIDVIESKNLLVVPTFFGNKIVAYTIK